MIRLACRRILRLSSKDGAAGAGLWNANGHLDDTGWDSGLSVSDTGLDFGLVG